MKLYWLLKLLAPTRFSLPFEPSTMTITTKRLALLGSKNSCVYKSHVDGLSFLVRRGRIGAELVMPPVEERPYYLRKTDAVTTAQKPTGDKKKEEYSKEEEESDEEEEEWNTV